MSSNRFALLADEGDSDDGGPSVKAPEPRKAPVTAPQVAKPERKPRNDYPQRGGPRKVFQEDRSPASREGAGAEEVRDDRGGRGRGRGGRGRSGLRGGGGPRPDRHSQTDVYDSHKKEHQGWGGDEGKRELNDQSAGWNDAKAEGDASTPKPDGWDTGEAPAESTPAPGPEPEVDPDANLKTLDEYLAERRALAPQLPAEPFGRKANEGADETQWKDGVEVLRSTNAEDAFYIGNKEQKNRARKAKEGKTFIEFEPRFDRPRGGDRGRGDSRGRGRGEGRGRGRGEFRGGRGSGGRGARGTPRTVDVDDSTAFPSLS